MMNIAAFIKRHPVLTYFALTFSISWGGMLLVVDPSHFPGTDKQLPLALLAMFTGPPVAGIMLTGLVHGRMGLHELLARLLRWRVDARWYAVALLTTPLLAMATLFALSLTSPVFLPAIVATDNKAAVLLPGIAAGLITVFEEIGWTGFVVPRLRLRYGILTTGLIVGVLWQAWHLLANIWVGSMYSVELSPALFLPLYFLSGATQLTAYRILMVWVYDRTSSLLVATVMHASHTASTVFILIPLTTGVPLLTYILVLAAALWVVVAAVAVANGWQLKRVRIEPTR